jgi:cytosine/adenosine deaminase-related metal-dependent hydrolase
VDAESFQAFRRDGFAASATDFVDQLGVLGPDCHIAHGVYLDAHDRDVLRARTTAVALCPRSNRVIGLDEPPVAAYLDEGNLIAVGTDSLASSPSLDLLADVAELHDIARRQGYAKPDLALRLLRAATLGGATALGLATGPGRVGQLQAGAIADLAFLDVPADGGVLDAIENVVRHGAGQVAATLLGGALRWSGRAWETRADAARTGGSR